MAPPPRKSTTPVRPVSHSRFADLFEGLGPWRNTFLGLLGAAALYAGYRIDPVRPILAMALAFGAPLVAIAFAVLPLREAPSGRLGAVALVLAGLLLVAMEASVALVFFPPAPAGVATLTPSQPDATIQVPRGEHDFVLQARGRLTAHGEGEGHYGLHVTREGGTYDDNLGGEFSRKIGREVRAMRRMAPTRTVTTTEVVKHELDAPGTGPLHVHLESIDGQVQHAVRVSVTHAPFYLHLVPYIAGLLLAAILFVEVLLAKKGRVVPLIAGAGIAAVLGTYVTKWHDTDDPLGTLTGGLIVSLIVGGVGGYLLARIAAFLAGTPEHAEVEKKPAPGRRARTKRRPDDGDAPPP